MERIFVYSGHLSDDIPKKVRIDKNQCKPQPANNKSSCVKTPRSVFGIFRVDTKQFGHKSFCSSKIGFHAHVLRFA